MPLVQVQVAATGQTAWVTEEDARAGQAKGLYRPVGKVLAETSTGEQYAVEGGQELALQGLQAAESSDVAALAQAQADAEIAGGLGGAARSFYQGAVDSAFLGLPSATADGEERENIARLRREQGAAYAGGRLAVDVATGVAGASKGALGAASRFLPAGHVARLSERLVAGGVAGSRALGVVGGTALEGAAGAAADYLADDVIREKPGLSGEAFAAQIGTGALLGGALGGTIGGVGAALERRAARRQAVDAAARVVDDLAAADEVERAAMGAVDDLAAESDRIPLASLVPPRAASPEGVAERVSGVYGALRQADAERVALQREVDDAILPGLDTLPTERAQALRDEIGQATAAYRYALNDAKGWARGLDREQRALTRARLDEERVRQAAARTRGVEETVEQRLERERLRTQRVAEGPQPRAPRSQARQDTPATAIPGEQPGGDLLAQLQRTQEQIGAGRSLSEVSAEGAAAAPKPARRGRQPKMPDGFELGPHVSPNARRIKGIPEIADLDEDALYVVKASDLRSRGDGGLAEGVQEGRKASIQRGWKDGKTFEPIDVTIYQSGKVEIAQGRHRLWAAAEEGRDIPVRFSRGIEEPTTRGKEAVAEWLAKHRRKAGVRYVDSATGAPTRGSSPRSVDKVVSFDGMPAPENLPAPIDLTEFRPVRPGEMAENLRALRELDPDIEIPAALARERAGAAADELDAEAAISHGAQQVGRVLDGDSDDAIEVFAKLDEAAEQMRAVISRARQAPAQGGAAVVSLPDAPATAPGIGRRIAGAVQNVGSALEVASALGVPVPSAAGIPVVGPALSSYLKLRAAWRALRGTGASLPATPAARAASARVRIEAAARASVQRTLQLGEKALKSTLLPGLVGRQAGKLAGLVLQDDAGEQRSMRADVEGVLAANPEAPRLDVARAAVGTPADVTGAAQEAASRALSYLQSVAPKTPGQGTPWALPPRYTPLQMAQWQERSTAVRSPAEAASALAAGARAPWAKEALVQVWPEIWGLWREELTRQQDVLARLPRPQRLAIGASFDIPLDPVQMPTYPRPSPQVAQQPQPSQARPTSRPRLAELAATDEQREELW